VTLRWALAALHLLALGIGLGAVWARASLLRRAGTDPTALRAALGVDALWGLAFFLWLVTGLWRLLGATEKATAYYMTNQWFMAKMGLLVLILALELWPLAALMRWRIRLARGERPDLSHAGTFASISVVQAVLTILMVVAATGMARGYGSPGR
jgi:putative membrane protein